MCSPELHSGRPEVRGLLLSSVQHLLTLRHENSFSLENVFRSAKKKKSDHIILKRRKNKAQGLHSALTNPERVDLSDCPD